MSLAMPILPCLCMVMKKDIGEEVIIEMEEERLRLQGAVVIDQTSIFGKHLLLFCHFGFIGLFVKEAPEVSPLYMVEFFFLRVTTFGGG